MPREQLLQRLIAVDGRVELSRLRSGKLDDEDWARISNAMERLLPLENRLIIDDESF